YVAGQQVAVADDANPVSALSITDRRPWVDRDGNGAPLDANGNIQFNELSPGPATPTFGRNVSTVSYDPATLFGWGNRGYNWEYTVSAQDELAPRMWLNGGWYRRQFKNQLFQDDLRYDKSSYDGPFCINAPSDPLLPGGGGYQVCNLYDLKPSVFALGLPANNVIKFADTVGGITDYYQGFEVSLESRFAHGAFIRGGVSATNRVYDNCNLFNAGFDALNGTPGAFVTSFPDSYSDGTSYCHREYPYRPDAKIVGSYTLPFEILFSGTYQFTRGIQTGGAGPAILAQWTVASAQFGPAGTIGST